MVADLIGTSGIWRGRVGDSKNATGRGLDGKPPVLGTGVVRVRLSPARLRCQRNVLSDIAQIAVSIAAVA